MQTELMDEIRSTFRDIQTINRYAVLRYGDTEAEIVQLVTTPGDTGDVTVEEHLGYVTTGGEALAIITRAEALADVEVTHGDNGDREGDTHPDPPGNDAGG